MARRDKDVKVRFDRLKGGLCMALDRAKRLAEDADALLAAGGKKYGAAVLFSLAAEELGKSSMLETLRTQRAPDSDGKILVQGFQDHYRKLKMAEALLPADALLVVDDAFNAEAYFDADIAFGERVSAGAGASRRERLARFDWLYVGWDDDAEDWLREPPVNEGLLRSNIAVLLRVIADMQNRLCA